MYNLTNFSSTNNFIDMATATGQVTGGWFWVLFLGAFLFVSFATFRQTAPVGSSIRIALFITAVLALFFKVASLISDYTMYTIWILLAISVFLTFLMGE